MTDLCKYKDALGEPGKGIHSYRLFGIAIADVLMTLLAGLMLAYLFKWSYLYTTISLFIIGIVLYKLFCVRTTIDKLIFD